MSGNNKCWVVDGKLYVAPRAKDAVELAGGTARMAVEFKRFDELERITPFVEHKDLSKFLMEGGDV